MERVPQRLDSDAVAADDDAMNTSLTGLLSSLFAFALLVGVVLVGLTVARSVFGTGSRRAAATEVAAKLVSYPAASDGVLRRRFVRALTTQHVVMPSGQRLAFGDLTVRVAPEDLQRLDPDGDVERLGDDAATLYRTHAEREGWATPAEVDVVVEVDPGLRAGWVPPARGTRRSEPLGVLGFSRDAQQEAPRTGSAPPAWLGWEAVGDDSSTVTDAPLPRARPRAVPQGTVAFPAVRAVEADDAPTVTSGAGLVLEHDGQIVRLTPGESVVLGRAPSSPLGFAEQEVSSRHTALRCREGRWQVRDVGSTNGTTLDGEPLTDGWTPLTRGVLALAGVPVTVSSPAPGTVSLESVRGR